MSGDTCIVTPGLEGWRSGTLLSTCSTQDATLKDHLSLHQQREQPERGAAWCGGCGARGKDSAASIGASLPGHSWVFCMCPQWPPGGVVATLDPVDSCSQLFQVAVGCTAQGPHRGSSSCLGLASPGSRHADARPCWEEAPRGPSRTRADPGLLHHITPASFKNVFNTGCNARQRPTLRTHTSAGAATTTHARSRALRDALPDTRDRAASACQ